MTSRQLDPSGLLAAGLVALSVAACTEIGDTKPCRSADDCSAPFLCCVEGVVLQVDGKGPICVVPDPSLAFCDAYLPHLVEGNPCLRIPAEELPEPTDTAAYDPPPPAADLCREGLTCCPGTLTCRSADDCPAAEEIAEGAEASGRACRADDECAAPEICCGISYYDRDGTCRFVRDCVGVPPGATSGASVSSSSGG